MFVVCRAKQQRRRVDRATGRDDDLSAVFFVSAVMLNDNFRYSTPGGIGFEALGVGVGQQGYVGILDGSIDAQHLRIGFRVHETGEPVARVAANAQALPWILLVKLNAKWSVERFQAKPREVVAQMLYARLVTDRGMRIRSAGTRFCWILAALAVDVIELFGLRIVRLDIIVRNRPCGRDTGVMAKLTEVFLAQSKQRSAVKLGVAADIVVRVRVKFFSVHVSPLFLSLVLAQEIDGFRIPVVLLARHIVAAFEDQDALACWRKFVGQGSAAGAGSDDDHVVMVRV